ncbi:hypothetical protein DM01DRAFT_307417 [Hesseltinella vesiculosa]|uniref:Uncharacterized protein n=1 Tax=Hesseltinella vesiculosa TaxID=101127 RepID=A0A1X2GQG4_9FUNG|nr:hypothetical protein DM01DRAFT_307417 [Hesseltinella vesiculosa]
MTDAEAAVDNSRQAKLMAARKKLKKFQSKRHDQPTSHQHTDSDESHRSMQPSNDKINTSESVGSSLTSPAQSVQSPPPPSPLALSVPPPSTIASESQGTHQQPATHPAAEPVPVPEQHLSPPPARPSPAQEPHVFSSPSPSPSFTSLPPPPRKAVPTQENLPGAPPPAVVQVQSHEPERTHSLPSVMASFAPGAWPTAQQVTDEAPVDVRVAPTPQYTPTSVTKELEDVQHMLTTTMETKRQLEVDKESLQSQMRQLLLTPSISSEDQHSRAESSQPSDEASEAFHSEALAAKQEIESLKTINDDYQVEITRLIDMVNDLEESVARTQADNYTKDRHIQTLSQQLMQASSGTPPPPPGSPAAQRVNQQLLQIVEENQQLKVQFDRMQDDYRELERAHGRMTDKLDDRGKQLNDLQVTSNEKEQQIVALQALVGDKDAELTSLLATKKTEAQEMQHMLDSMTQALSTVQLLESQYSNLRQSLDAAEQSLKDKDHAISTLQHNTDANLEELAHVKALLNNKDNELAAMAATLDSNRLDVTAHAKDLETHQAVIADHERTVQDLRETISKHARDLDTRQATITTHEHTVQDLRSTIDQQAQDIQRLTSSLAASGAELERSQSEHYQQLQEVIDGHASTLGSLKQQLTAMQDKLAEKDSALQTLTDQHQTLVLKHEQAQASFDAHSSSMGRTTTELEALTGTVQRLEQERSNLQAQLIDKNSQMNEASEELARLEQQYTTVKATLDEKESAHADLLKNLSDMELRMQAQADLQARINQLTDRVHGATDLLAQTENKVTSVQESVASLEQSGPSSMSAPSEEMAAQLVELDTLRDEKSAWLAGNQQLGELTLEVERLKAAQADFESTLTLKQDEVDEKQELVELLEEARANLVSELTTLKTRVRELDDASSNTLSPTPTSQPDASQDLIDQLQKEKLQYEATLQELQRTITELEATDASQRTDANHQQDLHQAAKAELEDLRRQCDQLLQQSQHLREEKSSAVSASEEARHHWLTEQTKVVAMTEDLSQLRHQIQQHVATNQRLQQSLDETRQLLANRDQNTEALQWQVSDMESSAATQVADLAEQLKDTQALLEDKTQLLDRIKQQQQQQGLADPEEHDKNERHRQTLDKENKDLQLRLERQLDAFNTIRGELTTVRERELATEQRLVKEKEGLTLENQRLLATVEQVRQEFQEHLNHMWQQHEAVRQHHEEDLSVGRSALDSAQVKLMQNGLSPVSENGFEWTNTDSEDDDHGEHVHDAQPGNQGPQTPHVGRLPPLEKPGFIEFAQAPRCSGCVSEVIDI